MKNIAYIILLLGVLQCEAFANVYRSTPPSMYPPKDPPSLKTSDRTASPPLSRMHCRPEFHVGPVGISTSLRLSVTDYSEAARVLFGNVVTPAALLASGLVPLGFLAEPLPDNTPIRKKLRCLYFFLSVASLANELLAIMYATVARSKLTETVVAPASSVFALIIRDFELPWVGANVHFIFGLLGFVGMIMIRAYTLFPPALNKAAAGLGASALLAMLSVVNTGVAEGVGRRHALGGNLLSLNIRYIVLIVKHLLYDGGIVAYVSLALALVSMISAALTLLSPETYTPTSKNHH